MECFRYKASRLNGGEESGTLDAKSKADAYRQLQSQGLRPLLIEPEVAAPSRVGNANIIAADAARFRLSSSELLLFTEEMAELLESGLQLEPALRIIESRKESNALRQVAGFLRQQVRDGVSFSAALRSCRSSFSELFCSMIAAGETAGALPEILRRQNEYLNMVIELRRRISAALIYPSIVFGAGIVLLFIFMTFLLPQLTLLLSKTGQQLPLMTRLLIAVSELFGAYWWLVGIILAGAGFFFWAWQRTPAGRMSWDKAKLHLPLIGGILSGKFLAEFCQTLATLVLNGVTLLDAISLFRRAVPNVYLKELLGRVSERVAEGAALSTALKAAPFFPPVLCDVAAIGEQSGEIAAALQRGAKRYDREFDHKIQHLTTLIQPLTILVVAVFVGLVAYSMITGILTSVSGLRTH